MACPEPSRRRCQTNCNTQAPSVMHLDLNSAFASMEQQANPLLRGVPTVVAAHSADFGCILASSQEAKLWGVKTGMRVQEGRERCPFLVVREADPDKYRHIHHEIRKILDTYSDQVIPKSIDEFVIDFSTISPTRTVLVGLAQKIQNRIKIEVGDWLTVSMGIATNRFLAKLASDLKHDEPFIIDHHNLEEIYQSITLTDLHGVGNRLANRLKQQGIFTPLALLHADLTTLQAAFRSRVSRDWHLRLRGWEVDNLGTTRRTFGQSYVLPSPLERSDWLPILAKLVDKATRRLRSAGYSARGAHLTLRYHDRTSYHRGHTQPRTFFSTPDLLRLVSSLIPDSTPRVKQIAVSFFDLAPLNIYQSSLISDTHAQYQLTQAVDSLNSRYGSYSIHPASMLGSQGHVRDAIAFGK